MANQLLDKKQELLHLISQAEELRHTQETIGWKDIVQPILDKTIQDTIGFKKSDGSWSGGLYTNLKYTDSEAVRILAYRQALVDFTNRIASVFSQAENAKKILDNMGNTVTSGNSRGGYDG
jgi:hypothetical protein